MSARLRLDLIITQEVPAMTMPAVLVATWRDGLFVVTGGTFHQELAGQPVSGLAPDGNGGALAIVGGRSLRRRTAAGEWHTIAESESDLSCCMSVGDGIYVGTDDAQVLRIGANGKLESLSGLNEIAGRDRWYAGTALIDGQLVGPPLGIRSMTATCNDAVLLANVHVGGIPRSTDGGVTWQPPSISNMMCTKSVPIRPDPTSLSPRQRVDSASARIAARHGTPSGTDSTLRIARPSHLRVTTFS